MEANVLHVLKVFYKPIECGNISILFLLFSQMSYMYIVLQKAQFGIPCMTIMNMTENTYVAKPRQSLAY